MHLTAQVPKEDFKTLLEYIGGLQGQSRKATAAGAHKILNDPVCPSSLILLHAYNVVELVWPARPCGVRLTTPKHRPLL